MKPTLADGGQAALACIVRACDAATPFSLILIDVMMADMDGITLARRIIAHPQLGGNVMLMLASDDRQKYAERLQSPGIVACLNKPIQEVELKETLLRALGPAPGIVETFMSLPKRALRILVAEDNPFNQRVAVLILTKMGHEATIAVNGRETIAALATQPFDLVLMDLQMPVMDGFTATAEIRSAEAGTTRHIPIIALTAHALKEDRDRAMESGMDGFVTKPIRQDMLRQAIEACVTLGRETDPEQPPEDASESPMDLAAALARVDGDRAFLGEMVVIFLEESPRLLAQIRQAVAASDSAGLVVPAHSLKNWMGNFVAPAALGATTDLEAMGHAKTLAKAGTVLAALEREIERLEKAMVAFIPPLTHLDADMTLISSASSTRPEMAM